MNWKIIEEKINETIPKCIKKVLDICGYDTIMSLAEIKNDSGISKVNFTAQNSDFSPILQSMVNDFHREKGNHRAKYSDFNRYFATYIFLKAGRSCYEFLCNNLPLPSVKTVCE